jgi:aminopeptidase
MDPRIREHAETIVEHSTDVQPGDTVVVATPPDVEELVVALFEAIADVGAKPIQLTTGDRYIGSDAAARAYLRNVDEDALDTPEHMQALYEASDVIIRVRGHGNASQLEDVPAERTAAYRRAIRPVQQQMLASRWCLTQYPTDGSAQLAGMSTEEYQNFVWDAINKDWDEQRAFQDQMVEILDPADEVRIVSGDTTDIRMSVAGNPTLNDHGEHNLPGGEVFTAPVKGSVEGEVLFDKPLYRDGKVVENAYLKFEDGKVIDHAADQNEDILTGILDTDEGARYLGELGIGMNRAIDRFSYNMLFDEKMGDTVHMAVGMAYGDTVGEDNEVNESAAHVDMIVDMSEDSSIEVDGEVVQRNGTFVFEDGFEA